MGAEHITIERHKGGFKLCDARYNAIIAFIVRQEDQLGNLVGYRLRSMTTVHGSSRKVHPTPEQAIASMKFMGLREARAALAKASGEPT